MMKTLAGGATLLLLLCSMVGMAIAAGGFTTTARGLQYQDLKPGAGAGAETGDVATIHFVGWLEEQGGKGRALYDTHTRHEPVSFVIGTDRVMPAWNEGVIGMRPGGQRLIKVPPELGYGARGVQDVVPPNSRLIFLIELLELQKH
jgi:FKBP-type peptidyl-prolyl cis-trans isomerase FkpA